MSNPVNPNGNEVRTNRYESHLPPMPERNASQKFVDLFNKTALDIGIPIQWNGDAEGLTPNLPDGAEVTECESRATQTDYFVPSKDSDVSLVLEEVEKRRQWANTVYLNAARFMESPTVTAGFVDNLNPAERAFLESTAPKIAHEADMIWGKSNSYQFDKHYKETLALDAMGDHTSLQTMLRTMMVSSPFRVKPADVPSNFQSINEYICPLPDYPDSAGDFSALWPKNFTGSEKEYLANTYKDPQHPVNLPYATMARYEGDVSKLAGFDKNGTVEYKENGKAVGWIVKGKDDAAYIVYNISFDPRLRPHLLNVAETLRKNAGVEVDGSTLHPEFKKYVLSAADYIENGQWEELLLADMNQTEGNIYWSFFMHEGYADQVRFPIMYMDGVRDRKIAQKVGDNLIEANYLEGLAYETYKRLGLATYDRKKFSLHDVEKAIQTVAVFGSGGFLKSWGGVAGNDYPKAEYPSLAGQHKTVIHQDTISYRVSESNQRVHMLIANPDAPELSVDDLAFQTVWHEITHGTALRGSELTLNGKTLDQAFGKRWGIWAEAYADIGPIIVYDKLLQEGSISEEALRKVFLAQFVHSVKFYAYASKEVALKDESMGKERRAHAIAGLMTIGWMMSNEGGNVFTFDKASGKFFVKWDAIGSSVKNLSRRLVEFSAEGDPDKYVEFVKRNIRIVSDDAAAVIERASNIKMQPFIMHAGQREEFMR